MKAQICKNYFSTPVGKFTTINDSNLINDCSELQNFLTKCKDKKFQKYLLNNKNATVLKNSRSTLALIYKFSDNSQFFIKIYRRTNLKYQFRYLLRQSRAQKSFNVGQILIQNNIFTPAPILAIEQRKFNLLKFSAVVNEVAEDTMTCNSLFEELAKKFNSTFFDEFLAKSLQIIAQFHQQNLIHGDLKISNLYYLKNNKQLKVGIWDFDGTTIKKHALKTSEREKDICRFVASIVDGLIKNDIYVDENELFFKINDFYRKSSGEIKFDIARQKQYIKKLKKIV